MICQSFRPFVPINPPYLWYATAPDEDLIELMRQEPGLLRDWDERYGDRMIKLVFIGQHLDKAALTKALDGCLE